MSTNKRKSEHIDIILQDEASDRKKYYFDEIKLIHRALPEIDFNDIDTSTEFLGKKLSFPLIISSMTGGSGMDLLSINRNLAEAAEATGIGMAVGSQRIIFEDSLAEESFKLRPFAPNALLFSNLGAVQLNYSFTVEHCQKAVDLLEADALYLHLNPLQEAIQPEGNTNFLKLADKISKVVQELSVPVIIKEVGAGISLADAKLLYQAGIKYIDVAGSGGTSWSRIENHRSSTGDIGLLFQDWGIPAPLALQQLSSKYPDINLISSGGLRSGIDIAKSSILGAKLAAMANPFLKPAMESKEAVIKLIEQIKKEFQLAMFVLGQDNVLNLQQNLELLA